MKSKIPESFPLPPGVAETADDLPANAGWVLDPELVKGRTLEEVRATPENATLFRFGSRPNLDPSAPPEPCLYLGLRPAIRVQGTMGMPNVAVYTFPNSINPESLILTRLLLPAPGAPPQLAQVIGLICTNAYHNSTPGLLIPPSVLGNGWLFEFGDIFLEVNTVGLMCHAPKGPRVIQ